MFVGWPNRDAGVGRQTPRITGPDFRYAAASVRCLQHLAIGGTPGNFLTISPKATRGQSAGQRHLQFQVANMAAIVMANVNAAGPVNVKAKDSVGGVGIPQ